MNGWVYFIRPVGAEGPVKIGHSYLPRERFAEMCRWSPIPLEIVATFWAEAYVERRFHARFRESWMHYEWFEASPELTQAIDQINADTFDIATLPVKGLLLRIRNGRKDNVIRLTGQAA